MVERWIIYEVNDPRIIGLRGKPTRQPYRTFKSREKAIEEYLKLKLASKFAGVDSIYFTYPVKKVDYK